MMNSMFYLIFTHQGAGLNSGALLLLQRPALNYRLPWQLLAVLNFVLEDQVLKRGLLTVF